MIGLEKEKHDPVGRVRDPVNLQAMTEQELLSLRTRIDNLLPVIKLADMDLERELTLQFRSAQTLQAAIIEDPMVPANQKAQVLNATASTIQSLVKMQEDYFTPERLKKIEAALVDLLNTWPAEQTEKFFSQYEKILEEG